MLQIIAWGWCKGQCKGQRVGAGVSARVEGWETKFSDCTYVWEMKCSDCIYAPFLILTKGLSVAVQKPVATGPCGPVFLRSF
jgi:hypothetical protein